VIPGYSSAIIEIDPVDLRSKLHVTCRPGPACWTCFSLRVPELAPEVVQSALEVVRGRMSPARNGASTQYSFAELNLILMA
jgi:hypothetical protein